MFKIYRQNSNRKQKICIIGGGAGGIFTLKIFQEVLDPLKYDVICFERYSDIGGQWNVSLIDKEVEPSLDPSSEPDDSESNLLRSPSIFYKELIARSPIPMMETPDFSLSDSNTELCYLDAPTILQHLKDYAEKWNLLPNIRLNTSVDRVSFDKREKQFLVTHRNLKEQTRSSEIFEYVIVATGHLFYPNIVSYPGQKTFPGQILHSKYFKDARRFKNRKVLVVGSSFSAEDVSLLCIREGALRVTVSRRGPSTNLKWPAGIDERPILTRIQGNTVHFQDGSSWDYDVIIYCTGYLHKFPFMEEDLKLRTDNVLAPPLYKQVIMPSNPKLFYLGMQELVYTFSLYWIEAHLIAKVIQGKIKVPSEQQCLRTIEEDQERESNVSSWEDKSKFQSDYIDHICELTGQPSLNCHELILQVGKDREEDISKYKQKTHFKSKFHSKSS